MHPLFAPVAFQQGFDGQAVRDDGDDEGDVAQARAAGFCQALFCALYSDTLSFCACMPCTSMGSCVERKRGRLCG